MVLHTDQDHPHVHLVIRALSEYGERLNISKATLREWRQEFARHLREHGVAANATDRAVRGENRVRKTDGIHRAMLRGASSHMRDRAESVASEVLQGKLTIEPGKSRLVATRRKVEEGWRGASQALERQGQEELVKQVRRFVEQMPAVRTEREQIAELMRAGLSVRPVQRQELIR